MATPVSVIGVRVTCVAISLALGIVGTPAQGQTIHLDPSEVARAFTKAGHLVIHGAAHSDELFLSSPEIGRRIRDFLAVEDIETGSLAVPFDFSLPN